MSDNGNHEQGQWLLEDVRPRALARSPSSGGALGGQTRGPKKGGEDNSPWNQSHTRLEPPEPGQERVPRSQWFRKLPLLVLRLPYLFHEGV